VTKKKIFCCDNVFFGFFVTVEETKSAQVIELGTPFQLGLFFAAKADNLP